MKNKRIAKLQKALYDFLPLSEIQNEWFTEDDLKEIKKAIFYLDTVAKQIDIKK